MRGEIAFMSDDLMDEPDTVRARTLARLPELLELDFDALLFAHGEPIPSGGRDALAAFIRSQGG
jgi:CRP-like cAMP-binding protein